MKFKFILLALLLIWPISSLAMSASSGNYITLAADQVVNGNYYTAGNKIEIFGTVNGDIFAAGNDIVIDSSNINGDIFAAGNTITIKGKVNGSLRLAGQKLVVEAEIAKNILAAGQYLDLNKDSKVQGHVSFAGQMASLNGWVGGRWESVLENLRLNGQIVGDAEVYLSDNQTANIDLASGANIQGSLKYWSSQNLNLDQTKVKQGIEYHTITQAIQNKMKPEFTLFGIIWEILPISIVALLWWRFSKKFFNESYDLVKKHPGKSLLWGLLALIVIPIILILLMITVVGIPLALILLVSFLVVLYLARILAAWLFIRLIQQTWWKNYRGKEWALLVASLVIMTFLVKLPLVGWLIAFIFYLWSWGAIAYHFYHRKNN